MYDLVRQWRCPFTDFHHGLLEQDEQWAQHLERTLAENRIEGVRLLRRRLRCYDGFVWYELGPVELPKYFPLVLCDGPAVLRDRGETFYGGWRYGILPVLSSRSITFGAMLADDADDARAPAILKRWCREFGLTARIIRSSDGAYAVLMPSGA